MHTASTLCRFSCPGLAPTCIETCTPPQEVAKSFSICGSQMCPSSCAPHSQFRRGVLTLYSIVSKTEMNTYFDQILKAVGADDELPMDDLIRVVKAATLKAPTESQNSKANSRVMLSVEEALANEVRQGGGGSLSHLPLPMLPPYATWAAKCTRQHRLRRD
jgi:hypothetical protein